MSVLPQAAQALLMMISTTCSPMPDAVARVIAEVDDITVGSAFTLRQIEDLSRRSGRTVKHRPYGFYASETRNVVKVQVDGAPTAQCPGLVAVQFTVKLTNRHIQVASDLLPDECRMRAATDHYRLHADADAAVIREYLPVLIDTFARTPLPAVIGTFGNSSQDHASVANAMKSIARPILTEMTDAQTRAIDAVDTPDEVKRLEGACVNGI